MEREKFMQEARIAAHRILEGKENGMDAICRTGISRPGRRTRPVFAQNGAERRKAQNGEPAWRKPCAEVGI